MKKLLLLFFLSFAYIGVMAQGTAPQVESAKITKTSIQAIVLAKDDSTSAFLLKITGPGVSVETRIENNTALPTYTAAGLKPGTVYTFTAKSIYKDTVAVPVGSSAAKIKVTSASSEGTETFGPSTVKNFKTLVDFPPMPTLKLDGNCPQYVGVSWTYSAPTNLVTNQVLEKSFNGSTWYKVADVPPYSQSYYDFETQPGKTMSYRVSSQNELNELTRSNIVNFQIKPYVAPDAPINLRTGKVTNNSIEIVWENPEEDMACKTNVRDVYRIEIKRQFQTEYHNVSTIYPFSTTYNITGLEENEPVDIVVYAVSDQGITGIKAYLRAKTYGPSSKPSNLIGVAFKDGLQDWALGISWTHPNASEDTDYYVLEYSTDSATFKPLAVTNVDHQLVNHVNISEGQKYTYRVKAGNYIYGESDWRYMNGWVQVSYSSKPDTPYGLTAKKAGDNVVLTWVDASNKEENYIVERSASEAGPFTEIGTVQRNTTTFTDIEAADASPYYRVKASNPLGASDGSNVARVINTGTTGTTGFITYPNPTIDKINVIAPANLKSNETLQVEVFNQANQLLYSKKFKTGTDIEVNMKKYLPGVYNVVITTNEVKETKKVVRN